MILTRDAAVVGRVGTVCRELGAAKAGLFILCSGDSCRWQLLERAATAGVFAWDKPSWEDRRPVMPLVGGRARPLEAKDGQRQISDVFFFFFFFLAGLLALHSRWAFLFVQPPPTSPRLPSRHWLVCQGQATNPF